MLDRSQSAPATLRQAATPELSRHQLPLSSSAAGAPPLQVQPPLPPPQPSSELFPSASLQPDGDVEPEVAEAAATISNDAAMTPLPPHPEEGSAVQAMEEEEAKPCPGDPDQVEMKCPPDPQLAPAPAASSEVEAVPSLAAALMELHELLVSNTRTQPADRSASCSPSRQLTPETNHMRPEAEAAEVNQEPELGMLDGHPAGAETTLQDPGDPEQRATEHPPSVEPPLPPAVTSDPSRLPPEHTSLSPQPMAVDSPEGASPSSSSPPPLDSPAPPNPPPPLPLIDRFPAEHIQQIQAAGFSAVEAAEALERAHGVVELALLVLLARSITVPT